MSNWAALDPNSLIPAGVKSGAAGLDVFADQLEVVRKGLALAQAFQATLTQTTPDVFSAVLNASIDLVEGLLQTGNFHVLFVPIAKIFDAQTQNSVPATLTDLGDILGANFADAAHILEGDGPSAYSKLVSGTRGNSGFMSTFVQSIGDLLDPNRPEYDSAKDAVAMGVVIAGTPSFAEAVQTAMTLNSIFRPSGNNDMASRTIPVPQNLKTKIVAVPSSKRMGVRLDWDPPKDIFSLKYYPGVTVTAKRYAVIRSTDAKAMSARHVTDFFTTNKLTLGLKSNDAAQVSEVVAIGSAGNSSFVDLGLEAQKTYYYCVAWDVDVVENKTTTNIGFTQVSGVVKAKVTTPQPTQNSTPPDWIAYKAPLELFPELAVNAKSLIEVLRAVADQAHSDKARISKSLSMVTELITRNLTKIDMLTSQLARFSAVLAAPLPSMYTTVISGVGGNAFLTGELSKRLNDTTDTNRPPFDAGEYVFGLCIVAGGPRVVDVKPLNDFLEMLFGESDSNPLLGVLASIDNVLSSTEPTVTFGVDMKPLPTNTDGTVVLPDGTSVDSTTVDPLTGRVTVTTRSVISDAGVPVAGDSADNPTAGETNVVTNEELC